MKIDTVKHTLKSSVMPQDKASWPPINGSVHGWVSFPFWGSFVAIINSLPLSLCLALILLICPQSPSWCCWQRDTQSVILIRTDTSSMAPQCSIFVRGHQMQMQLLWAKGRRRMDGIEFQGQRTGIVGGRIQKLIKGQADNGNEIRFDSVFAQHVSNLSSKMPSF